jgi:hypothetical protein
VRAYEPRWRYLQRFIDQEICAYELLATKGSLGAPRYYGCFVIDFPERSLDSDREVTVFMIEHVKGKTLLELKDEIQKKSFEEIDVLVEKVCASLDGIHNLGLSHGYAEPQKCFLNKHTKEPVWIDYSYSNIWDPNDNSDHNEFLKSVDMESISDFFDEIFYLKGGDEAKLILDDALS